MNQSPNPPINPIRVLHVVQSFDLSGRSRVIVDLVRGLKARGIEGEVVCFASSAGYGEDRDGSVIRFDRAATEAS